MKKSFTLMEILFVVVIVSFLIYSFWKLFQLKERDYILGQACVVKTYWTLRNFVDNASTGRGLFVASQTIPKDPDKYFINVDTLSNKITLTYSGTNSWTWIYSQINFTGNWFDSANSCYGDKYYIDLTWTNYSLSINRGLIWDINNPAFSISGSTSNDITWAIELDYCLHTWWCKILWLIQFDKRTYNIEFNKCLLWTGAWSLCEKWSK